MRLLPMALASAPTALSRPDQFSLSPDFPQGDAIPEDIQGLQEDLLSDEHDASLLAQSDAAAAVDSSSSDGGWFDNNIYISMKNKIQNGQSMFLTSQLKR